MAAGGAVEYAAATNASNAASSDISFLLFGNQRYMEEFQTHQRNQQFLGIGAAIIYLYHILDFAVFNSLAANQFEPDFNFYIAEAQLAEDRTKKEAIFGLSFTFRLY